MATKVNTQCPNCNRWFTNQKSLRHHIRACRRLLISQTEIAYPNVHKANPLLSVASTRSVQFSTSQSNAYDLHSPQEVQDYHSDFANNDSDGQYYESNKPDEYVPFMPSDKKQAAVNNSLDIMLHDLLQKHKASLLLYDEISNLFNNYLDSPTFDRFTKLRTRKALIRSMQKSLKIECLRPINCVVHLHDNSLATVPVFNTKYMIMNLLSDDNLMNEQFFPDGYNIFSGDVDRNHPVNDNYGEVHTVEIQNRN